MSSQLYPNIYKIVAQIPFGRVATYGQIAGFLRQGGARQVGYALAATPPDVDIPWHRVINSRGEISERIGSDEQRELLLAEGVLFNKAGRVDFSQCSWEGPDWQWLEANEFNIFQD
ncbi:MAG: methylated-DNA-protein-cysteine methyltransferase-like protein [Parasphingorhabdus sp.]